MNSSLNGIRTVALVLFSVFCRRAVFIEHMFASKETSAHDQPVMTKPFSSTWGGLIHCSVFSTLNVGNSKIRLRGAYSIC